MLLLRKKGKKFFKINLILLSGRSLSRTRETNEIDDLKQKLKTKKMVFDDVANTGYNFALNKRALNNNGNRTPGTPKSVSLSQNQHFFVPQQGAYISTPIKSHHHHHNHHPEPRGGYFENALPYNPSENYFIPKANIHYGHPYFEESIFAPNLYEDYDEQDAQTVDENSIQNSLYCESNEYNYDFLNKKHFRYEPEKYRKGLCNLVHAEPLPGNDEETRMIGFNKDPIYLRKKSLNMHGEPLRDVFPTPKEEMGQTPKKFFDRDEEKNYENCERKFKKRKLDNQDLKLLVVPVEEDFRKDTISRNSFNAEICESPINQKEEKSDDEDGNWMKGIKGRSSKGSGQ